LVLSAVVARTEEKSSPIARCYPSSSNDEGLLTIFAAHSPPEQSRRMQLAAVRRRAREELGPPVPGIDIKKIMDEIWEEGE
jgi:hypothetical protein